MPLEWFKHYMTESKEVERAKKIRRLSWVRCIRDVVVIARKLEMHQLAQVALIANYNVMMHDQENSAMLIHELVLSKRTKTIDVDELYSLAKHTYWFLKASSEKDTILVYSTDVESVMNNKHVDNLDFEDLGFQPEINHRKTPSVLLLGSDLKELNGVYLMEHSDSESSLHSFFKNNSGGNRYSFREAPLEFSMNEEEGFGFELEEMKILKRKTRDNDGGNSRPLIKAVGSWKNTDLNPIWEHNPDGRVLPVPFRYFLEMSDNN